MKEQTRTLSWKIDGEFITELARTWFWDEDRDYSKSEELLLSCMDTDEITEEEKKDYCLKIIEGKLKLVGINTFTLEEDGENVRPIYNKIKEKEKELKLLKIKNHIEQYPMMYVDIYSTSRSYKSAKSEDVTTYEEVVSFFAGDRGFYSTWRQDAKNIENMNYLESYQTSTMCGLWLLYEPELIYKLIGEPLSERNRSEFFEKLYDYLNKSNDLDYAMKQRQERYAASMRIEKEKTERFNKIEKTLSKEKIEILENGKDWEKRDSLINKMSLKEYDEYLKKEYTEGYPGCLSEPLDEECGLISPNGDFYLSTFGGHNLKAYFIICGMYESFGYKTRREAELMSQMDKSLDVLIERGWIAVRYLPSIGYYLDYDAVKRHTKQQLNKLYEVLTKYDHFNIRGLSELEKSM